MATDSYPGHEAAEPDPPKRPRRRWPTLFVVFAALILVAATTLLWLRLAPVSGVFAGNHTSTNVPEPRMAGPVGAGSVGSYDFPVPSDAIYVSLSGSDSAAGTKTAPLQTVQQAVSIAAAGQTIVLRGGAYNQRVTVLPDKPVTIESYPHESVWLDGSVVVSQWQKLGRVWVSNGWTARFDNSQTFTKGAPPSPNPKFDFVNGKYPLAADPDQVWINGKALTQVGSQSDVTPGTFAVDYATSQLFIGANPTHAVVRASNKSKAFSIQASGSVLRGIGVRRFASSLPQFGAITVEAPNVTVESVTVTDDATTGLFIGAAHDVVRNVTLERNGLIGMYANFADDLTVSRVLARGNNSQHFNQAPVAGGFKITSSRTITVRDSSFDRNFGPGLWFDESDYDANVISNSMSNNAGYGLVMEISARFTVAGNTVVNDAGSGIEINDTDNVQLWHNTVANTDIDLRVAQDSRRASDPSIPGHNAHRPLDDPSMPWTVSDVVISDNVFSGSTGNAVVCVQDNSGEFTATQLGVTLNGNAYQRSNSKTPTTLVLWGQKGKEVATQFASLRRFRHSTGEERAGVELPSAPASHRTWIGASQIDVSTSGRFPEVPVRIAALLGWHGAGHAVGAPASAY